MSENVFSDVNIVGNLVGSFDDLVALMALAAQQKVTLHTANYALTDFQTALRPRRRPRTRPSPSPP